MPQTTVTDIDAVLRVVQRHWGFQSLRPLQEQAMRAELEGRDSVVVMPTGGGKSLCYQVPAVLRGGLTVVLSPLLALMKDQVDNLHACGIAASRIDSSQSAEERREHEERIVQGKTSLVFVSPERLVSNEFSQWMRRIGVRSFAVDEAHCISHWGHDFRPEYRQLRRIKELFPGASIHAYTATATPQVRKDIAEQLALTNPEVLVGNFDRPNLNYRVLPRHSLDSQVLKVLERHQDEAGIIYCLRRRDVDELAIKLKEKGYKVKPYHAGLDSEVRRATQDEFAAERIDLIVATVAFGMGIDRSNIRFVLHTTMPKSVEHYQQETGRAGRDGLEAECVLLHSGADCQTWRNILERSAQEAGADPSFLVNAVKHLNDMDRYARGAICRHRALVAYFGQTFEPTNCAACDVCLGDTAPLPDSLVVAQKILSCVARVKERFGMGHVIAVLRGESNEKAVRRGHDKLSTFGLLRDRNKMDIRDWIYQLVSQSVLVQNDVTLPSGEHVPILGLNEASWEVMRGQREVRLLEMVRRKRGEKVEKSRAETVSWDGVDRELFESLRSLRREIAVMLGKPPYVVFADDTLREMARLKPRTREAMLKVRGVGEHKLREYGERFLQAIAGHGA
jgi:ATP-dependent DNA helicase RecQ